MLTEKAQRVRLGGSLHALRPGRHPQLLCRLQQPAAGDARERENLILDLQIVHRHADRELYAPAQQRGEHLLLLPGKVDEAVHVDPRLRPEITALDLACQQVQPVGRVRVAVGHRRVIGGGDQRQVVQLVARCRRCVTSGLARPGTPGLRAAEKVRRLFQLLGADLGAFQLVHGGEQHLLQLRLPLRRGVKPQAGAHGAQRQGHAQQPPALVQAEGRAAPLQLGQPPGQTREAEHLAVEGEAVAADPAELPLRLVAVLFGHQQDAAAPARRHRPPDLLDHGGGFARTGLSQYQPQHGSPSFCFGISGQSARSSFLLS